MKIETSLDWQNVEASFIRQLNQLNYNPDLHKMLKNIQHMVDELSKIEVTARRIHKTSLTDEKVYEINKAIDHLEKLILIAKLVD